MRLLRTAPSVELTVADCRPEPARSILDRSLAVVSNTLDNFRADELSLEAQIAELTERLRQTRVAITAFSSAEQTLTEETSA
jgi:hypothetical protein